MPFFKLYYLSYYKSLLIAKRRVILMNLNDKLLKKAKEGDADALLDALLIAGGAETKDELTYYKSLFSRLLITPEGDDIAKARKIIIHLKDRLSYNMNYVTINHALKEGADCLGLTSVLTVALLKNNIKTTVCSSRAHVFNKIMGGIYYADMYSAVLNNKLNTTIPCKERGLVHLISETYRRKIPRTEENYRKALIIEPENYAAMFNLANLFLNKGKENEARAYFNKIIEKGERYLAMKSSFFMNKCNH